MPAIDWPRTEPLALARGDRAVVRFRNMSPEAHPMHLHGQSFRVLLLVLLVVIQHLTGGGLGGHTP